MNNFLFSLARILVVVNFFVIVGLFSLFAANIIISIIKIDYHTVLSFWELIIFIPFFILSFIGMSVSVGLYETHINS